MSQANAIGIDLGTTNSCVGVFMNGKVKIFTIDQGKDTMPSYVAFTDAECLIGDAAKEQADMNPSNTVFDAKRLIGRKFSDIQVQKDMKHWPFKVVQAETDLPKIQVQVKGETKTFFPKEISAMVLVKLKETAEAFLGFKVIDAVIAVPAYFDENQRQATKDAGAIAGFNVLEIINAPTAAAIACGLGQVGDRKKNLLVFDLGGEKFNVSLLSIENGIFKYKSTRDDTTLSGQDFDNRMITHFVSKFSLKNSKIIKSNPRALGLLRNVCERAKRDLSIFTQTSVVIVSLFNRMNFQANITRAHFEEICKDLFLKIGGMAKITLGDTDFWEVDETILFGGSSLIPKIQQLLSEDFRGAGFNKCVESNQVVCVGAALQAAILSGDKASVENYRDRIAAKISLDSYCNNMKHKIESEEVKDVISEQDRIELLDKLNETICWLDNNQTADKEAFKNNKKDLKLLCNSILTKLHVLAEGAPSVASACAERG